MQHFWEIFTWGPSFIAYVYRQRRFNRLNTFIATVIINTSDKPQYTLCTTTFSTPRVAV